MLSPVDIKKKNRQKLMIYPDVDDIEMIETAQLLDLKNVQYSSFLN